MLSGNMSLSNGIKKNMLQLYHFAIVLRPAFDAHDKMPAMGICALATHVVNQCLGYFLVEVLTDSEQQLWMTIFRVPRKVQHGGFTGFI